MLTGLDAQNRSQPTSESLPGCRPTIADSDMSSPTCTNVSTAISTPSMVESRPGRSATGRRQQGLAEPNRRDRRRHAHARPSRIPCDVRGRLPLRTRPMRAVAACQRGQPRARGLHFLSKSDRVGLSCARIRWGDCQWRVTNVSDAIVRVAFHYLSWQHFAHDRASNGGRRA
jgi:hypothetical protein